LRERSSVGRPHSAFKTAAKGLTMDADWTFMQEVWLERLIKAAEMQGAKIPSK
jgi:hypothetical protein